MPEEALVGSAIGPMKAPVLDALLNADALRASSKPAPGMPAVPRNPFLSPTGKSVGGMICPAS